MIQTVRQAVSTLEPKSTEWMYKIIQVGLGLEHPHAWQASLATDLYTGRDVFATVRTGGGKSTLVHAPVLAAKVEGIDAKAIVVGPTKALLDDQVRLPATAHALQATHF